MCASGAAANATLWQVQLTGIGKGAFAFQIKATASEAFREYPDPRVCTFNDLEAFSQLRLAVGTPLSPQEPDPADAMVCARDHRVTLYGGKDWQTALKFVLFILTYKVMKGRLSCMPKPLAQFMCPIEAALPALWELHRPDVKVVAPKPFNGMPPRGYRHVAARLEPRALAQQEASNVVGIPTSSHGYILFFFGGICSLKHNIDRKGIPTIVIRPDPRTGHSTRTRYLQLNLDMASTKRVITVLQDVLLEVGTTGVLCVHGG